MKMADIIGAPHALVSIWHVGYRAGLLFVGPKKNPYWDDDWQRPVKGEEHKFRAWEEGRRQAVEEMWLATKAKGEPMWVRKPMSRPRRGLRPV